MKSEMMMMWAKLPSIVSNLLKIMKVRSKLEDEKPVYGFKLPGADGVSDGFFINL